MKILLYPDDRLTRPNATISKWTADLDILTKQMFDVMYETKGVGLAAPQVGENIRLFILNLTGNRNDKDNEKIYFNPIIELSGDQVSDMEGCLSFPRIFASIKRYDVVKLMADTPHGKIIETFTDFGARAIQHEFDHIDSQLFIDKMTPADLKKFGKILQQMRSN